MTSMGEARRVRAVALDQMPTAYDLYEAGPASAAFSYALSLMACAVVVQRGGRQSLADVYAGLAALGPDAMTAAQDGVYRRVTGLGSAALARQAGRAMVTTFGRR